MTIHSIVDRKFIKFIFIGALNTLFGYLLFSLLIFFGIHYVFSSFISTVGGVIFNFFTTGRIVFKSKKNQLLGRFFLVYAIVYTINLVGLYLLKILEFNMYISASILVVPLAVISFILNKNFVFREEQ